MRGYQDTRLLSDGGETIIKHDRRIQRRTNGMYRERDRKRKRTHLSNLLFVQPTFHELQINSHCMYEPMVVSHGICKSKESKCEQQLQRDMPRIGLFVLSRVECWDSEPLSSKSACIESSLLFVLGGRDAASDRAVKNARMVMKARKAYCMTCRNTLDRVSTGLLLVMAGGSSESSLSSASSPNFSRRFGLIGGCGSTSGSGGRTIASSLKTTSQMNQPSQMLPQTPRPMISSENISVTNTLRGGLLRSSGGSR
jgi:hypothetical protein